MAMAFPAGTTVAGVFTKNKCPGAPVDWCRAALKGGKARGAGRHGRQCQRLHRQGRARDLRGARAEATAKLLGCKPKEVFLASTGVIGERLPTEKLVAALPKVLAAVAEAGFGARRARHHDHRHLPQGGDAHGADRRHHRHHRRHRQGLGHDRARHGDDAVLPRDRREDPGGRAAGAAEEGLRPVLQLRHRRLRHLHLRHRAAVRHRRGEAPARAGRGRRRPEGLRPRAERGADGPGPAWSRATARARRS